jgi:uncharacterized protein YjbI with pentapeptide repeats
VSDTLPAPKTPHPPDPDPEADPPTNLDDAADVHFENADFSNQRFLRSSIRRVELHLCRLTGIEVAEATWSDVVVTECRADFSGWRHAKLTRVVFRDCRLEEADFAGAVLTDLVFERCELRRASFASCRIERVEFTGCSLAELAGVESLRGARMPWNDILENAPLFAQGLGIQVLADE